MIFENDIKACIKVLKAGGVILYPTDTIWGIGCDATNEAAVESIYSLKQRAENKSMIVLLADKEEIKNFSKSPSPAILKILETEIRPTTIIYPDAKNLAKNLIGIDDSIAIRIANDSFCNTLIKKFSKPIVSTSANISGEASPAFFAEISSTIKNGVDYIVKHRQEEKIIATPSKILLWKKDEELVVIRG